MYHKFPRQYTCGTYEVPQKNDLTLGGMCESLKKSFHDIKVQVYMYMCVYVYVFVCAFVRLKMC